LEYPRRGIFSVGFVTRSNAKDDFLTVFLATSPNPTSGFLLLVPRDEVAILDIPVEEAIKLVVSSGAVMTSEQAEEIHRQIKPISIDDEGQGVHGDG